MADDEHRKGTQTEVHNGKSQCPNVQKKVKTERNSVEIDETKPSS